MSRRRILVSALSVVLAASTGRAQHSAGSLPGGPAAEGLPPSAVQAFESFGTWLRSEEGLAVAPDADLAFLRSLDLADAEVRRALASLADRASPSLEGMRRLGRQTGEERRAAGRRLADELRAAKVFAAEREAEAAWLEASAAVREKVDTPARLQALAGKLEARAFLGDKVVAVRNGIAAYLEALGSNPSSPAPPAEAPALVRASARMPSAARAPQAPEPRPQEPEPGLATKDGLLDVLDSLEFVFDRHHWTKRGLASDLRRALRATRADGQVRVVETLGPGREEARVRPLRPELRPSLDGIESAILSLAANTPGKRTFIDELELFFESLEDAANEPEGRAVPEGIVSALHEARAVRYVRTGGFFTGAWERRPPVEARRPLRNALGGWGPGFAREAEFSVFDLSGSYELYLEKHDGGLHRMELELWSDGGYAMREYPFHGRLDGRWELRNGVLEASAFGAARGLRHSIDLTGVTAQALRAGARVTLKLVQGGPDRHATIRKASPDRREASIRLAADGSHARVSLADGSARVWPEGEARVASARVSADGEFVAVVEGQEGGKKKVLRLLRRRGAGYREASRTRLPDSADPQALELSSSGSGASARLGPHAASSETPERRPATRPRLPSVRATSYVTGLLLILASISAGADNERVLDPSNPIGPLGPGALADAETMVRTLFFFVVMTVVGAAATALALALKRRYVDGDERAVSDLPGLGMIGAAAGAVGSLVVLFLK